MTRTARTSAGEPPPPLPRRRAGASARAVEALRRRLAEGAWNAGDRLPSEPTLAGELGVSRVSVRAALAQLEAEGAVTRKHGSGTYVNSVRPLVRSLHLNVGSDELITSGGHVAGIAEMTWRRTTATREVAERLYLAPDARVVELLRVRTSDGTPVTVEHDYFPVSLLPAEPVSLGPSLYAFLAEVCGVDITFGVATLEPDRAGDEWCTVLGVEPDALCLVIRQVDYDATERPVSYSVERHLAHAFDFQLVRQGPFAGGRTVPARPLT